MKYRALSADQSNEAWFLLQHVLPVPFFPQQSWQEADHLHSYQGIASKYLKDLDLWHLNQKQLLIELIGTGTKNMIHSKKKRKKKDATEITVDLIPISLYLSATHALFFPALLPALSCISVWCHHNVFDILDRISQVLSFVYRSWKKHVRFLILSPVLWREPLVMYSTVLKKKGVNTTLNCHQLSFVAVLNLWCFSLWRELLMMYCSKKLKQKT